MELELAFLQETINIFLIRDPEEVLISFSKVIEHPVLEDIGIKQQAELFEYLQHKGHSPIILNGKEVRNRPEQVLKALCERIDIPFYPDMLNWEAGALDEDGVWAPYWYAAVHKSTGFQAWKPPAISLSPQLNAINASARPYYDLLQKYAI